MSDEQTLRARLVATAVGSIGQSEVGGDNRGPFVRSLFENARYTSAYDAGGNSAAWCTAFQYAVLSAAAPGIARPEVNTRAFMGQFPVVHNELNADTLEPGNIIFMTRSDSGAGMHSAMIESYNPRTGIVTTIEGNVDSNGDGIDDVGRHTYTLQQLVERGVYGIGDVGALARQNGALQMASLPAQETPVDQLGEFSPAGPSLTGPAIGRA